jgi:hypothetical protein
MGLITIFSIDDINIGEYGLFCQFVTLLLYSEQEPNENLLA